MDASNRLFVCPGILAFLALAGCDQARYDNALDSNGDNFRPPLVRVWANPDGVVRPGSARVASRTAVLEAYDTTGFTFGFWSGDGIEGDTSRQVVAPLKRDTNDFLAWFVPVWGHSIVLDGFDQTYPRCGNDTRWCSILSVAQYVKTRKAIPFRGWYAFRDSGPNTSSRVEPIESKGWDSALGTGPFGIHGLHLTLSRQSGAQTFAGVGLGLGPSPTGYDLRPVYSIIFWSWAKGPLTVSFKIAGFDDGGLESTVDLHDTAWTWHQVWTVDLTPRPGSSLATAKGTWATSGQNVTAVEFLVEPGSTNAGSTLVLGLDQPTLNGIGLEAVAP